MSATSGERTALNTMRWAEISVEAGADATDAVGNCLNEVGCGGFVVQDTATPPLVVGYLPVDDRIEDRLSTLTGSLEALASFGVENAGTEITLRYVQEDDWANAWKAYFKPIPIGRRLMVTPPWEDPDLSGGRIPIVVDPGIAFGTGSHPTTQLCLAALEDYVRGGDGCRGHRHGIGHPRHRGREARRQLGRRQRYRYACREDRRRERRGQRSRNRIRRRSSHRPV